MTIRKKTPTPVQQAHVLATQSIDFLLKHELAPAPVNYSVCYEYFHGARAELTKALDAHLSAGKKLDEVLLEDLYEKHVATDLHHKFHGIHSDLQEILQSLMQNISETSKSNVSYQRRLESDIERLGEGKTEYALHEIASDMITAAVNANQQQGRLQEHLQAAQKEAEQLRAELEEQRREAMIDPLTDLYNRRAMEKHLSELWELQDQALSVVIMDIDHFKRINDTYGHAIGDVVIRNVADTVRKSIRGADIAVRFGGEEFLVLLPETALDGASKVAETIRKRIEALRLVRKHDNFALDPFTISLGVAQRRQQDDRESFIERADQALYCSKTTGRNRVSLEVQAR